MFHFLEVHHAARAPSREDSCCRSNVKRTVSHGWGSPALSLGLRRKFRGSCNFEDLTCAVCLHLLSKRTSHLDIAMFPQNFLRIPSLLTGGVAWEAEKPGILCNLCSRLTKTSLYYQTWVQHKSHLPPATLTTVKKINCTPAKTRKGRWRVSMKSTEGHHL